MNKPEYSKRPIGHISSLAKTLSVNKNHLIDIADNVGSFYYLHERKEKPDGSFRDIYGVKNSLKTIQERVHERIFSNVKFPNYLKGSIRGRNHIHAVEVHSGAKLIIRMDISQFYPSLSSYIIFDTSILSPIMRRNRQPGEFGYR